jgi:RNA polymerase sigma-70 factor (ECF subfamily)
MPFTTPTKTEQSTMHAIESRYKSGLRDGRFHRQSAFDKDERPGELKDAIARAKTGDAEAVRYLYLRFSPNVYGYARSMVRDEHEAEDVTQQVFARLMTSLARYEDRGAPFSAWLLRITHNLAIDHMRRRLVLCDETMVRDDRGEESRSHELGSALRGALETLPETQRQVIVLRHVGGLSPGEIADAIDRSEDSIHGLHHRGRRALQASLRDHGATPMVAAA